MFHKTNCSHSLIMSQKITNVPSTLLVIVYTDIGTYLHRGPQPQQKLLIWENYFLILNYSLCPFSFPFLFHPPFPVCPLTSSISSLSFFFIVIFLSSCYRKTYSVGPCIDKIDFNSSPPAGGKRKESKGVFLRGVGRHKLAQIREIS